MLLIAVLLISLKSGCQVHKQFMANHLSGIHPLCLKAATNEQTLDNQSRSSKQYVRQLPNVWVPTHVTSPYHSA
jgi:hypothetical protein